MAEGSGRGEPVIEGAEDPTHRYVEDVEEQLQHVVTVVRLSPRTLR